MADARGRDGAHPFKAPPVHLPEQRLERPEVGVALKLVARQPLAEHVVLAQARLHPARVDEVGETNGLQTLARPLHHALVVALILAEQRDHRGGPWEV